MIPDQREQLVEIVGAEQARGGQNRRILFDSAKVPWIINEIDRAMELGEVHSILHIPIQRRMVMSLEKIQGQSPEISVEAIAHAYFLVLSGKVKVPGQTDNSYESLSFFGPVDPQIVSGNGEVLKVSFSGHAFKSEVQNFTDRHRIKFRDFKPTMTGEILEKIWFTGNEVVFSPETPGWNKYFSLGLAWSPELYTEEVPDHFDDRTLQLFVPLPHMHQPNPAVEVLWQTLGPYPTSAVVSKNEYGPYELGGIPDQNHPIFFQQKNMNPGSLIFLVHVNDPSGIYKKQYSQWHANLRDYDPNTGRFKS